MMGRTRGTVALLAAMTMTLASACDDGATEADSGPPRVDAGGGADAGPGVDPLGAVFTPVTTSGEGPWGLWGYTVAAIDDHTALVMGGTDAGGPNNLVYDAAWRVSVAADGSLTATEIATTGPAPRYCGCMAIDRARNVAVVYGGRNLMTPMLAPDTWELDLATDTWTEITTATQNPGTLGCMMGYSASADRMYMFGGASAGGPHARLFRLDPTAGEWIEIAATGPLARYDGALFESRDGEAMMLFGGSYGAMGSAFYADLWRFDPTAETWTEIALPSGPEGRRTPWLVRDPDRHGLYVAFGYDGRMQPMGDFWYADLDALTWTEIEIDFDTGPVGRGFAYALPGGDGALGTLMAGYGTTRPVETAWRLTR